MQYRHWTFSRLRRRYRLPLSVSLPAGKAITFRVAAFTWHKVSVDQRRSCNSIFFGGVFGLQQTLSGVCPGHTYNFVAHFGRPKLRGVGYLTYVVASLDGVEIVPRTLICEPGAPPCNIEGAWVILEVWTHRCCPSVGEPAVGN